MTTFWDPYRLVRPALFSLDAERAHRLTLRMARTAASQGALRSAARALYAPPEISQLKVKAFGLDFANPLGLAAGLDKDGEAIDLWGALGFGFVELGTVTPGDGQPGNDRPRLERILEDRAIVNRMGFNNRGAPHLARRLAARTTRVPCGANLGKAKVTPLERAPDDYEEGLTAVWPVSDYVVINVSSPNTPGLRDLQAVSALEPLLTRVMDVNRRLAEVSKKETLPILLKVAPDLADEDVDQVADLAKGLRLDGIIATNTTARLDLASRPPKIAGGLSGPPLAPRARAVLGRLFRRLDGAMPLVGVGGISSAEDALERIRAGATLVQVYSALIYEGPSLVARIVEGLGEHLVRGGFSALTGAVGVDT